VGLRSSALFFFSCCAAPQHCSAFFSFFLPLRYRAAVTFLYGGDFVFFYFVVAYALVQYN
jgi:hypothetical protein